MLCYKLLPPKHVIAPCWSESIESISHMQNKNVCFPCMLNVVKKNYCSFVRIFLPVEYNVCNVLLHFFFFFNVTRESFNADRT